MKSILIGNISSFHGVRGEVKIYPYTDDVDNLVSIKEIYLESDLENKLKVIKCRVHKNMLIVKFEGIDTIEAAAYLKSKDIYIDKDKLKKLEKDNYYIEDLIGMEVFEKEDAYLGKLKYVYNTAANDVYEIETEDYGIIYLPAIHQVIKKVDIENKRMYVEIMKGLV